MQQSADLKTMGLKVTVPRLKILDLFQKLSESQEAGKRHLSAEEVYKLLLNENSDIGLATVYRVLTISTRAERFMSSRKAVTTIISSACAAARSRSLSILRSKRLSGRSLPA